MGKTTKYVLITLGVLIVLLIIGKATGIIGKPQKTQIATDKAAQRDINETVSASGKIKPEIEVKISSEVSGEIVELPIKEGDVVHKGQLLCRVRPDILKSGFDRAVASYNTQKASVGNASQMLRQSQANFANSLAKYNRTKELYGQKVVTAAEFDAAKAEYEGAKASLEAAKQNVIGSQYGLAQSQASVKEAQDNLAKTSIYSPVDGVVSKLSVEKGERVVGTAQMTGTEIMTISDLSKMDVNVDVNENDINRVSLGDSAKIAIDAFNGRVFNGVVYEIGSSANVVGTNADQVTNFTVKVRVDASSYKDLVNKTAVGEHSPFRPGLTATVDIQTNHTKALSVPIQSVTTREEKKDDTGKKPANGNDNSSDDDNDKKKIGATTKEYVFVYANGKVSQVQVTTGIQDDTYIQIKSGLKGGEEVVSGPYSAISKTLKDKMEVEKVDKSKLFSGDNK
ncbi:efflux RND transporter periplasmic adaptor subunit [Mucilaginibacter sp. KACC 22063]|uniref:efflux RND transporter periplasmic adaptor subunit n=1 Tax=Mucilaginibacter sp. KACC 22063 TaxID=3025666 RepID=UPI0023657E82|nr:efflux RND transporter periplasmic adaptor subunit [Mucilaginibacter sp. KACC 22063]WDF56408.1 efflux RND transporter periplasmic adaptor subunit [Mucilaginibacter sp. KACC 22063]